MGAVIPDADCLLLVGGGGGGDAVSAYLLSWVLRGLGYRTVVASVVWERLVHDPVPGPIPLTELAGSVELLSWAGIAKGSCSAWRGGVEVSPTACRLAEMTGEPVGLLDLWRGEVGVRLGLLELASLYGCDAVVVVDVGGDVLARGCEEDLWSPLADSVVLAAAVSTGLQSFLLVYAAGADGELPQELVLERLASHYASYVWSFGLPRHVLGLGLEIASRVGTEASLMPLEFLARGPGVRVIRGGSRRVRLTACTPIAFLLDAQGVYRGHVMAKAVTGTLSLAEARSRLNAIGVYTELDLEEDLARLRLRGVNPDAETVERVRREGRRLLGWRPCG